MKIKSKFIPTFTGIKVKFLLIVILSLSIVYIVDGWMNMSQSAKLTRKNVTQGAIAYAQLSTRPYAENYDLYFDSGYFKFQENIRQLLDLNSSVSQVQIIDTNGNIKFDSQFLGRDTYQSSISSQVSPDILKKVQNYKPAYIYSVNNKQELKEIIYPYLTDWQSHPYSVRYFISYDQVNQSVQTMAVQTAILIILFIILSSLLLSVATNRTILNPLKIVINSAKAISAGAYGRRITTNSRDEIRDLSEAVNQMAHTLEQNITDLKELDKVKDEFIDIAAHNLKIPLNHIKFNLEYLVKNLPHNIGGKNLELIKDISINYEKLQLLSEDLTNIAAIDQGSLQNNIFMPLDLVALLKDVVDEKRGMAESKGIKLKAELLKTAPILGDNVKIKQVFLNILDNAIKFTPQDGLVEVVLSDSKDSYQVDIQDTGVGMTKEEVKKLFKKFYRAPSSASYSPDGSGLGLYLTKLIVDVHHGYIYADSAKGKGSTFSVVLLKLDAFKKRYPFK